MELFAYIDGSSLGNPGEAGFGVVLRDEKGSTIEMLGRYIGKATNNVAEYQGLIGCLELAKKFQPESLTVHSDSQLMVRQVSGEYKVKQPHLQALHRQVLAALRAFTGPVSIIHVPRERNKEADKLARTAVYAKSDIHDIT